MKRLMDWIAGRLGYVPRRDFCEIARERDSWSDLADKMARENTKRFVALTDIIAQDTPNSNATVKRMVKIARDGLGGAA